MLQFTTNRGVITIAKECGGTQPMYGKNCNKMKNADQIRTYVR
jgi:hypothetical protein